MRACFWLLPACWPAPLVTLNRKWPGQATQAGSIPAEDGLLLYFPAEPVRRRSGGLEPPRRDMHLRWWWPQATLIEGCRRVSCAYGAASPIVIGSGF